jgi:hypothetical protein
MATTNRWLPGRNDCSALLGLVKTEWNEWK